FHTTPVVGVNVEVTVAKLSKDRDWAQMPTGPRERRISIHILRVDGRAGVKQKLDSLFVSETGGTVKRSLALGAAVSHETSSLSRFLRYTIRIRALREEDSHD